MDGLERLGLRPKQRQALLGRFGPGETVLHAGRESLSRALLGEIWKLILVAAVGVGLAVFSGFSLGGLTMEIEGRTIMHPGVMLGALVMAVPALVYLLDGLYTMLQRIVFGTPAVVATDRRIVYLRPGLIDFIEDYPLAELTELTVLPGRIGIAARNRRRRSVRLILCDVPDAPDLAASIRRLARAQGARGIDG